jgi:precorrin-6A/cobalt-precorrin-6A reductase
MPGHDPFRLLILGGTGEAVRLAHAVSEALPAIQVTTSLAGRTSDPPRLPGTRHIGGFGGADGLSTYLGETGIQAVIDATHPFAARISSHAHTACTGLDLPLLRLDRQPWPKQPEDRWIEVDNVAEAAVTAAALGRRLWLTLGNRDLDAFAGLDDHWCLIRMIERPAAPLPPKHYEIITGRGPFSLADERRLIDHHGIEVLVAKASGGDATYAKLAAAREAGIPVVMIRRPNLPDGPSVTDIPAALDWLGRLLNRR